MNDSETPHPYYTLGQISPNSVIHAIIGPNTLCGSGQRPAQPILPYYGPMQVPTCQRCLTIVEKRQHAATREAVFHTLIAPVPPYMPEGIATENGESGALSVAKWSKAIDHLFQVMRAEALQLGKADPKPALTLEFTLLPLLRRYMLGDRSLQLYADLVALEERGTPRA